MTKIHDFGICVSTYSARGRENLFPDIFGCPHPICKYSGILWRNGFYERHAIGTHAVYRIPIQRYRCPVCGLSTSLIPSFLTPRFQYSLSVIHACILAVSVMQMSLVGAAAFARPAGLSYQLVRFYKMRVQDNATLYIPVLNLLGSSHPVSSQTALAIWAAEVQRHGVELFAIRFNDLWHRSFLSKHTA